MRTKIFFLFLFSVLSIAIVSAKDNYQLQYYPCAKNIVSLKELGPAIKVGGKIKQKVVNTYTSVNYAWLSKAIGRQVKDGNIEALYDVPGMGKLGDIAGTYFVFMFNGKAIVLFNRGNKSYIVTGHKRLPKKANDHDSFSFAYADVLYPEIFLKGGEALTFVQIEKMLGAKILPLTQENLQGVFIAIKTVIEPEIISKPTPKPVVKTITADE